MYAYLKKYSPLSLLALTPAFRHFIYNMRIHNCGALLTINKGLEKRSKVWRGSGTCKHALSNLKQWVPTIHFHTLHQTDAPVVLLHLRKLVPKRWLNKCNFIKQSGCWIVATGFNSIHINYDGIRACITCNSPTRVRIATTRCDFMFVPLPRSDAH